MWKKQFEDELRELREEVKLLKKNSHPPQEYVCCKKCGCKIAKIKNKKLTDGRLVIILLGFFDSFCWMCNHIL